MTRKIPFTQAAIVRTIRAAEKAGYSIGGVRPDGTVLVFRGERPDYLSLVPKPSAPAPNSWDDV